MFRRKHPPPQGGGLFIFALWRETYHLSEVLAASRRHVVTGMGRERAMRGATEAISERKPDWVVTAGITGAIDPALEVGDILYDENELNLAARLPSHAKQVAFHCYDTLATKKSLLRARTNAHAWDMESEHIRNLCREHRIPSGTVRVVSDRSDHEWGQEFEAMVSPSGGTRYFYAVGKALSSPSLIPIMLKLSKDSRIATKNLGVALNYLI